MTRNKISEKQAKDWEKFYKKNNYYHRTVQKFVRYLIPKHSSVLEFGAKGGEMLNSLPNTKKCGVSRNKYLIDNRVRGSKIFNYKNYKSKIKGKYDYILLSNFLNDEKDVQMFVNKTKTLCGDKSRYVVFGFNYLWKPLLDLLEKFNLKLPTYKEQNWLSKGDIDNFFQLEGFENIKDGRIILLPINIPLISNLVNRYIAPLPIFNWFCFASYGIYREKKTVEKDYSVSIIIPARNESGHMKGIFKKVPHFTDNIEIVFVEGGSSDDTFQVIKDEIKNNKSQFTASLHKQRGKGKGDAVRLGFSKAKNDIFMILDADLTVDPKELPKFYKVIASRMADFVMGSRLIYPMESEAMRNLNVLGNKIFSIAFSFLLDSRIKDTLCGTKVLFRSDYNLIRKNRSYFGDFDPFGDYDLIFGASKLNLKILEIPIRYKNREYGETNISRFTHGWLLMKMVAFAARKLKFVG
ncbi:glycosyltransferase family 2 protein [Patescibacteria group bacterium]